MIIKIALAILFVRVVRRGLAKTFIEKVLIRAKSKLLSHAKTRLLSSGKTKLLALAKAKIKRTI